MAAMKRQRALGALIRRIRESRHHSQSWLADQIGMSVGTVARWENDGLARYHRKLPAIARALGCSPDELAANSDELLADGYLEVQAAFAQAIPRDYPDSVRCWLCGRQPGDCHCWQQCGHCGRMHERGKFCTNEACKRFVWAERSSRETDG